MRLTFREGDEKGIIVRPGRSMLIELEDLSSLRLTCLSPDGLEAEIQVVIHPR